MSMEASVHNVDLIVWRKGPSSQEPVGARRRVSLPNPSNQEVRPKGKGLGKAKPSGAWAMLSVWLTNQEG